MQDLSWLGSPRLPIVQAPMAGVQDERLALAACAAGALGSLPAAMLAPAALQDALRRLRAATAAPVNVNFFAYVPPPPDPAREARWRARLAPYLREAGLDPEAPAAAPTRRPFGPEAAEALEAAPPAVVSFHFGLPAPELLARVRRLGARVLSTATTVAEARWLAARGVDGVIAQGLEAGGHRGHFLDVPADAVAAAAVGGQASTWTLLPQIVAAVDVPVVAAGGIVDAATTRRAFALGARAVQAGTAFLLCPEATTSAPHRTALQAAGATTALTNLFSGGLARGLVNRLMRELGPVDAGAPAFPLAAVAVAPLRAAAEAAGRGDFSPLWAGSDLSACRPRPAADVVADLAAGVPAAAHGTRG